MWFSILLLVGAMGSRSLSQKPAVPQDLPASSEATAKEERRSAVATILQSGSTNSRAYQVEIHSDGSATATISGAAFANRIEESRSEEYPAGTIRVDELRHLLKVIGDVSTIPTGNCAKSVSFGTRTQISYAGKISGDLQCIRRSISGDEARLQTSEELRTFIQDTLRKLKIDARRIRPVGNE